MKEGIRNRLTDLAKKRKWRPYIVFTILVFALYGNTLNHFFVLDDAMVITHNRFTQQGFKGIPALLKYDSFAGTLMTIYNDLEVDIDPLNGNAIVAGGRYRPLSLVTFAMEIGFFGKECTYMVGYNFLGNAFLSHLVNVLMYLFTVCLLFLILNRLFPPSSTKKWYLSFPFLAALLFLAHPIHTEVVANIKGRDEILALMGSFSALWFSVNYIDSRKVYHLVLSGVCLFLGLLSKENAITFVGVIPVTLYYFVNRTKKEIFITLIPLIIASALFLFIRSIITGPMDTAKVTNLLNNPFVDATQSETFATIFYTLLLYIKLLFFPHPLTYDYYPYHIEITNWSNPVVIFSLLFYIGMGIYAIYGLVKKRDIFSWSIWLYLMPLSVVSNLFFPIGAFMGERFVFFSSIGFAVLIGWLIYTYIPTFVRNERITLYVSIAVLGIILCLYSIKTISRNAVWKDNFTLITTDVKTSKNSAKGNYEAGGAFLDKAVQPDDKNKIPEYCYEAEQYFNHAIKIYPIYVDAMVRLGDLHAMFSGDIAQSLHYYAMALQYNTLLNKKTDRITREILTMTNVLLDEKKITSTPEEILQSCDELLHVRPNMGEAYFVKGVIYGKYLNKLDLALANLEKALSMDFTKTVRFYEYLGTAYGMSGDYPKALQYLLKAVEMGTEDRVTYLNLGVIYEKLGDKENARLYTSKGKEMAVKK